MATWKSTCTFPFSDWSTDAEAFVRWEYQTTSDILTLVVFYPDARCSYTGKEVPHRIEEYLMCPDKAESMYLALRHWVATYRGSRVLKALDGTVKEGVDV